MSISYPKQWLMTQFPIERYKKDKQLAFHHLLPSTQSDAFILNWLKTCTEKFRECINFRDPVYGLAPLDVAILAERVVIVAALCEYNTGGEDKKGWTSKQHAIARNNPQILAHVSKVQTAVYPFLQATLQPKIPGGDAVVCRYRDTSKKVRDLTQNEFEKLNGAKFYDGISGTPDTLFHNWVQQTEKTFVPDWVMSAFRSYSPAHSSLFLAEEGAVGRGVRAGRDLGQGEFLTLYGSELLSKSENTDSIYSTLYFTGNRVRNFGAMVNDGCNTHTIHFVVDGVFLQGLFAIRKIAKDEPILSDYGHLHRAKWSRRVEYEKAMLQQSFGNKDCLLSEWPRLQAARDADGSYIEYMRQLKSFTYLFRTPSMMLSFLIQGRIHATSVQKLLKDDKFLEVTVFEHDDSQMIIDFYSRAFAFVEKLPADKALREHIASKFEQHVRAAYVALALTNGNGFDRMFDIAESFFAVVGGTSADRKKDIERCRNLSDGEIPTFVQIALKAGPIHGPTEFIRNEIALIFS